ncbi:uncharacterized protein LOC127147406 isoform X14 [Cucumis melo]|uniref:Uncharacterized protein LOC127147406 isoform X13 n=1 Tax=Cucumis melo TaxID=3656 RepID=A0ABM3KG94_CUCME|nr:uncharacterized protein LOC127147406 isoform X13 [Cucumis melo]XP_050936801.1 uncharacterized protein LOC127147406 isoform X14 [Cucumis melo]
MPRTRPQRGASIIQASPSPTSPHIPLSIPARRRGIRGTHQTLPPSKKQSQDISYLHEQARLECTPTPRCKHCPRKPIRASTRHPLSLPAQRSDVALRRNPPTKHKAIARHLVSSRTSPLGVHAHTEVQALSAQAHPSINSTPALTPCPMDKPIVMAKPLHQARSNRKTSPLGVHAHTEVQALSKQNPSKNVNLTSRSHSLPDVGARHSIDFDQTLPPSKKQLQDISYLHEQTRLECTPTPRCKHCPRKPIRASTRHPLSLPAQRSDVALRRNPPTKHKAIARHLVSSRTSPLGVHAHTEVQALSAQAHPSINSTPALTPCPMDKPIVMAKPLHQARSNRKTSPLGVHAHTEVQALSKQNPSKNVNLTSRSHSLPDVGARHSIDFDQTLPPSKKQLQDISYLHEQTRLECTPTPRCKHCPRKPIRASTRHPLSLPARRTSPSLWPNPSAKHEAIAKTSTLGVHAHTEVQALSKHAHPALTPCPTVGCGTPAEPFVHQARSNRKLSRLLTNKPAWSARPHRGASIVRASPSEHQLDTHSHSPPAAGGGTPPAPTPQAYVPMMGAMCLKGRRRGIGVPPRPAHAGRSPPYIVHSGFFGSGRLAYEKAEMSHHAINFDCVIIMTGT